MILTEDFLKQNYFVKDKIGAGSFPYRYEDNDCYICVELFRAGGSMQQIYMENKVNRKTITFSYRDYLKLTTKDFMDCLKFIGIEDNFIYDQL